MLCHIEVQLRSPNEVLCVNIATYQTFVMKKSYIYALMIAASAVGVSCQPAMPMVPDSGRKVVPPQGSTGTEKPWNAPTKTEGDAVLGPLSNMRR